VVRLRSVVVSVCLIAVALLGACARGTGGGGGTGLEATGRPEAARGRGDTLVCFYAGSLAQNIKDLERIFEAQHPGVDFRGEASGSQTACRKISELHRECDILASADYEVIPQLLFPEWADWYLVVARNSLVIAYTDKSKYGDEINAQNWYRILLRPDVRFGRCDPNLAPVGYRTLQMWQLADLYYKDDLKGQSIAKELEAATKKENVLQFVTELLPRLESMAIDYAFVYRSDAMSHNLRFVTLPDEINLSNEKYADFYKQAKVEITGKKPGEKVVMEGIPALYGVTIPKNAPNPDLAMDFMKLLLSEQGRKTLEKGFLVPVFPALTPDITKVPRELAPLARQADI